MRSVASGLVAAGLVAGFLLLFGLVNAGNVYRVECPRLGGGPPESGWTWDPIRIPYVGYEPSGCETHTSMRLALDAIGLWSIEDAPRNPHVGFELNQPYDSSFINLWVRGCSSGESVAFCRCAIDEYTKRLRPDEFETLSAVAYSPGGTLAELPENVRDAVEAVERNCREAR
jgi:hypothetical protein